MFATRPGTKAGRGRVSRRQMRNGGCAGSGRALRLDPFGLPVRFSASDAAADGRVRDVELHRERVVGRRSLLGMRMALNMPVSAYEGISLRLLPGEGGANDVLAVVLKHRDPALTLPLFVTSQPDASLAANAQLGELHIERPRPRRRRRSALKARRPSILLRRGRGKVTRKTPVH